MHLTPFLPHFYGGKSWKLESCHENKCQESRTHSESVRRRNIVVRLMRSDIVVLLREEELEGARVGGGFFLTEVENGG
jgi:hypothetical protein